MTVALFDLDNTLLSGDSDHEWGNFLIKKGLVDEKLYKDANDDFHLQYREGRLDIFEYTAFSFQPLSEHTVEELDLLHEEFMATVISPMIGRKALQLVQTHRNQGHVLAVITATNHFITGPIVKRFDIPNLIATNVKLENGRFSNKIDGTPCFREGKVERIKEWLAENNEDLEGSFFYSDSHNDLSLMELVTTAIAVDPDDALAAIAKNRQWETISLLS